MPIRIYTYNLLDKEMEESTKLYDRKLVKRDFKNSFSAAGGANILDGDLADKKMGFLVRAGYSRELTRSFFLDLNANAFQFVSGKNYTNRLISLDLNASVYLLPDDNFGPYLYAGFGVINDLVKPEEKLKTGDTYFKIQYGVGVEYFVSERIGIFAFGEHNLAFSDELDRAISGKRNDFHYNFGLGIKYYFGKKRNNDVFEKIEE